MSFFYSDLILFFSISQKERSEIFHPLKDVVFLNNFHAKKNIVLEIFRYLDLITKSLINFPIAILMKCYFLQTHPVITGELSKLSKLIYNC